MDFRYWSHDKKFKKTTSHAVPKDKSELSGFIIVIDYSFTWALMPNFADRRKYFARKLCTDMFVLVSESSVHTALHHFFVY